MTTKSVWMGALLALLVLVPCAAWAGEEVTKEQLGGASTHATKSGVCDLTAPDDPSCLLQLRTLLSYLPSNNAEMAAEQPQD